MALRFQFAPLVGRVAEHCSLGGFTTMHSTKPKSFTYVWSALLFLDGVLLIYNQWLAALAVVAVGLVLFIVRRAWLVRSERQQSSVRHTHENAA